MSVTGFCCVIVLLGIITLSGKTMLLMQPESHLLKALTGDVFQKNSSAGVEKVL